MFFEGIQVVVDVFDTFVEFFSCFAGFFYFRLQSDNVSFELFHPLFPAFKLNLELPLNIIVDGVQFA